MKKREQSQPDTTQKERRKSMRIKEALTVVPCPSKLLLDYNFLTRDISEDGICLLSDRRMEIGEVIRLGIYIPEEKQPVEAVGKVMRRNESEDVTYPYILGIQFIEIDPKAYEQICNHIRYYFLKS